MNLDSNWAVLLTRALYEARKLAGALMLLYIGRDSAQQGGIRGFGRRGNRSPLILRLLCRIFVGPSCLLAHCGRSIFCRIDNLMCVGYRSIYRPGCTLTNTMVRFQTAAVPQAPRPKAT